MSTFAEQLLQARLERAWSLREASAHIGISHTYLSALEKGMDPRTGNPLTPSPDSLLKICNAYHFSYRELSHYFRAVNESDFRKFLVEQLSLIRQNDKKLYQAILAEVEKNPPPSEKPPVNRKPSTNLPR